MDKETIKRLVAGMLGVDPAQIRAEEIKGGVMPAERASEMLGMAVTDHQMQVGKTIVNAAFGGDLLLMPVRMKTGELQLALAVRIETQEAGKDVTTFVPVAMVPSHEWLMEHCDMEFHPNTVGKGPISLAPITVMNRAEGMVEMMRAMRGGDSEGCGDPACQHCNPTKH